VAITDTGSGNTDLHWKQEPLPPVKVLHNFQAGLSYYPFRSSEDIGEYALDASYTAIRVLGVKGQIRAEVDTKSNWKAGVRAFMEF
jgi:hypothetical protein